MSSPNAATRRTILANLFVHGSLDKRTLLGSRRDFDLDFLPGDGYISEDTFDAAREWLVGHGLVDWRINRSRKGRPGELRIGPSWGHVVGIVIGHASIRCAIGDGRGDLVADGDGALLVESLYSEATERKSAADLLHDVAVITARLLERAGVPSEMLRGVTVAIPAPIDRDGRLINHRGWTGLDTTDSPGPMLARELGNLGYENAAVIVENDANVTAIGEWHLRTNPAEKGETLVAVKVSGGVGGALVSEDGILVRGAHGAAGEIGHTPVDVKGIPPRPGLPDLNPQEPCPRCGVGVGHLESYVSATAVLRRAFPDVPPEELASNHALLTSALEDPQHDAHDRVLAAVEDAGSVLGRTLAPICEFTDPGTIVIAGRMRAAEQFTAAIAEAIQFPGRALPEPPRVVASTQGWSGVTGAIRCTLEQTPPPIGPVVSEPVRKLFEDMRSGPASWQRASALLGQPTAREEQIETP